MCIMRTLRYLPFMTVLLLALGAGAARADLPEHRVFTAEGERLLL